MPQSHFEPLLHLVDVTHDRALLAWGGFLQAYDANGTVLARSRTSDANHAWLQGLAPDTRYIYRVRVNGRPWAGGERCDWGPVAGGGLDLAPGSPSPPWPPRARTASWG